MTHFYEIPAAAAAILMLTDEHGELTPEAFLQLEELQGTAEEKVAIRCKIRRNFLATAAIYEAEIDRMEKHMQAAVKNADRIKDDIAQVLTALGIDRMEAGFSKLRFQKNPPSVQLADKLDYQQFPPEYVKVMVEANKSALLAAYKAGQPLPEGVTVTQTRSLRIS